MINLETIERIESGADDEFEYYAAIQEAINDGSPWSLQGSYGRTMMRAIESGHCLLGHFSTRDYFGNEIPSRDDVEEGTVGSYGWVVVCQGKDWADAIKKVGEQ